MTLLSAGSNLYPCSTVLSSQWMTYKYDQTLNRKGSTIFIDHEIVSSIGVRVSQCERRSSFVRLIHQLQIFG